MKNRFAVMTCCLFLLPFAVASVFAQPAAKAIADKTCSGCHNLKRLYGTNKNAADWAKTLDRMITKGAAIKPGEKDAVLKYLNMLNR
jgi:hypothetical protein